MKKILSLKSRWFLLLIFAVAVGIMTSCSGKSSKYKQDVETEESYNDRDDDDGWSDNATSRSKSSRSAEQDDDDGWSDHVKYTTEEDAYLRELWTAYTYAEINFNNAYNFYRSAPNQETYYSCKSALSEAISYLGKITAIAITKGDKQLRDAVLRRQQTLSEKGNQFFE